jgi:hypothetical protein
MYHLVTQARPPPKCHVLFEWPLTARYEREIDFSKNVIKTKTDRQSVNERDNFKILFDFYFRLSFLRQNPRPYFRAKLYPRFYGERNVPFSWNRRCVKVNCRNSFPVLKPIFFICVFVLTYLITICL